MANRTRALVLAPDERTELERLARASRARAGLSRRARAVALMADGLAGVESARRTGYTPVQISRLRRRLAAARVAGLQHRPRPGRPHTAPPRKTAEAPALPLTGPPPARSAWPAREP